MTNILDKEEFQEVMETLAKLNHGQVILSKALKEAGWKGSMYYPDASEYVLAVLERMFCDKKHLIGFYFTDMNHEGKMDSMTTDELWELLVQEME